MDIIDEDELVFDNRKCIYPKEKAREEDVCYGQDVVLYYEEHGKYGDNICENDDLLRQDKFEDFISIFPLYSIEDWGCCYLLDGKEVPPFYDHPEMFSIVDKSIRYDENGDLSQDNDTIHTHLAVCFHPYQTTYNDINELRKYLIEWADKYQDIKKITIVKDGSWYNEGCDLVIIEGDTQHPEVSIYEYID